MDKFPENYETYLNFKSDISKVSEFYKEGYSIMLKAYEANMQVSNIIKLINGYYYNNYLYIMRVI